MGSIRICPSCGLETGEMRCPRCNTLKVVGCTGSCLTCKIGGNSCSTTTPDQRVPSADVRIDPEHPGTAQER